MSLERRKGAQTIPNSVFFRTQRSWNGLEPGTSPWGPSDQMRDQGTDTLNPSEVEHFKKTSLYFQCVCFEDH